jgi:tight adherence protein C
VIHALLAATSCGTCAAVVVRRWIKRPGPPTPELATAGSDPFGRVGRVIGRRVQLLGSLPDRFLGAVVSAVLVTLVVDPRMAFVLGGMVLVGAVASRIAATRRRRRQLANDLPGAIEVLRMAVAAGETLQGAIGLVAREIAGPAGDVFARVWRRVKHGESLVDALLGVASGHDAQVEGILVLLATVHRSGSSVGAGLSRAVVRQRDELRRQAQQNARRLPVAMLLPLLCCVLPAFVLVTIVPVLAGGVRGVSF